jgi:hypothetical protein
VLNGFGGARRRWLPIRVEHTAAAELFLQRVHIGDQGFDLVGQVFVLKARTRNMFGKRNPCRGRQFVAGCRWRGRGWFGGGLDGRAVG